jgi:SAM-dependent methyltransferase
VRFSSTASYYARHRPQYPAALFDLLVERFGLGPESRVLDLAAGTGHLALPLAPRVGEVVAVDLAPEMLDELRAAAPPNVRTIEERAEEVGPELGSFALATIGRAFHWLERDLVLSRLEPLAAGVAIVGDPIPKGGPWGVVDGLAREWVGDRRPRHSGETWAEVVGRSPYARVEEHGLPARRVWSSDDVVGWTFSLSWASPALLGDRRPSFEAELRRRLAALGGDPWTEETTVEVVLGFR